MEGVPPWAERLGGSAPGGGRRRRESHPGRSACGRIEHRAIPRLKAAHSSQTGDRPESSQILETRDFRVGHRGPLLRTASS